MVSKPGLLMLAWQAPHLSGRERAMCGRDRGAAQAPMGASARSTVGLGHQGG